MSVDWTSLKRDRTRKIVFWMSMNVHMNTMNAYQTNKIVYRTSMNTQILRSTTDRNRTRKNVQWIRKKTY